MERKFPIVLYGFTLFLSAFLMFVLQPMFGKILLPLLGGTPSVWNTCMVFYQAVLFLGYSYAHFISSKYTLRLQVIIHLFVVVLSIVFLPVALPEGFAPPTDKNPILWLMTALTASVGLPFFVVTTTAPLLQKWFSNLNHEYSSDPYFLYAASNVGSVFALLSYPFLIEPVVGLSLQKTIWTGVFIALILLLAACAYLLLKLGPVAAPHHHIDDDNKAADLTNEASSRFPYATYLRWFAYAFVPASLLLGVTQYISTDIASVPLLWVIPLTLYLLSFILVFSSLAKYLYQPILALQAIVLPVFIAFSFINPAVIPYEENLGLHLLAFFAAIMVCHGELAKARPKVEDLTKYYLIMSFAGLCGGLFNSLIAPFIFDTVIEYPIMIIAALLLRPIKTKKNKINATSLIQEYGFVVVLTIIALYSHAMLHQLGNYIDLIGTILILLAGMTYAFRNKTVLLACYAGIVLMYAYTLHRDLSNTVWYDRTFFGVLSVREFYETVNDKPVKFNELWHGTTKHGAQAINHDLLPQPLAYYSHQGPIGQVFKDFDDSDEEWNIAVIGLGTGALLCYAKPGQSWDIYEIDPAVAEIATESKYFSYYRKCAPQAHIVLGDARLTISQKAAEDYYNLIIIDAFSSDAIPTHLLTLEALKIYFSKLKNNGIIAFHITNRHLDLERILSALARALNVSTLIQRNQPVTEISEIVASDWVVMARKDGDLAALENQNQQWRLLRINFNQPWTDDYSNILEAWK